MKHMTYVDRDENSAFLSLEQTTTQHFGHALPSQSLGLVLKKLHVKGLKETIQEKRPLTKQKKMQKAK